MEVYLKDRIVEVNETALIKAQAAWRGAVVRKKMKSLKNIFEDIFCDIEDNANADPWNSGYLTQIWTGHSGLCQRGTNPETEKNPAITVSDPDIHGNDEASVISMDTNINNIGMDTDPDHDDQSSNKSRHSEDKNKSSQSEPDTAHTEVSEQSLSPIAQPSKITNETSIWDSVDVTGDCPTTRERDHHDERQQIVLELLWVQQAINSRKQYLKFKNEMG